MELSFLRILFYDLFYASNTLALSTNPEKKKERAAAFDLESHRFDLPILLIIRVIYGLCIY